VRERAGGARVSPPAAADLGGMGNRIGGRRKAGVEERFTRPQGLYEHRDIDQKKLRKLILEAKLAPCYPGADDAAAGGGDLEECPICFLVSTRGEISLPPSPPPPPAPPSCQFRRSRSPRLRCPSAGDLKLWRGFAWSISGWFCWISECRCRDSVTAGVDVRARGSRWCSGSSEDHGFQYA